MIALNLIIVLLTIVLVGFAAVQVWFFTRRKKLRWIILDPQQMMDISPDLYRKIEILYDQKRVSNSLTKFTFLVHNNSNVALDTKTGVVRESLKWKTDGTVVDAWRELADPDFRPCISVLSRDTVEIKWDVFNPGWKALFSVLCEGTSSHNFGSVSGVFTSISRIVTRRLRRYPSIKWVVGLLLPSVGFGFMLGLEVWSRLPDGPDDLWMWIVTIATPVIVLSAYLFSISRPLLFRYALWITKSKSIQSKLKAAGGKQ